MTAALTAIFNKTWNGAVSNTTAVVLASGNVVSTVFVPNRWQYLRITNSIGAALIYVTADSVLNGYTAGVSTLTAGTTPAAGADTGWAVYPGETINIANNLPLWWQGFGGPNGSIDSVGLDNYTSRDPPQHATATTSPNPGTVLQLLASTTGASAIVEGAG